MQDGVRNVFSYHMQKALHSYYNVLLGQSNVQRVWFGSPLPISYTLYQVRVSVCMF